MNTTLEPRRNSILRPLIMLLAILAAGTTVHFYGVHHILSALRELSQGVGPGPFVGIYALAVMVGLPASALTILCGTTFGPIPGLIVASAGCTLGAALAFLTSRYLARAQVESWFDHHEKFEQLNLLTSRHGAEVVALARLVPVIPFGLMNYGFGVTHVRFSTYLLWSWLSVLPALTAYIVGSDMVLAAMQDGLIPWHAVAVLVVLFLTIVVAARKARGRIKPLT